MNQKALKDLENEIFNLYPQWQGELTLIEILTGRKHGSGSPYVIVQTEFAKHKVSIANLRKKCFPKIKTALNQDEYCKKFSAKKVKELTDELFAMYPKFRGEIEFLEYIPGKSQEFGGKKLTGGPYMKVKSGIGIHIVSIAHLRKGHLPTKRSAVKLFESISSLPQYTVSEIAKEWAIRKEVHELSDLEEYVDISTLNEDRVSYITKNNSLFLVEHLPTKEFFLVRKKSITDNAIPSVKSALNDVLYLNKITPNEQRKHPITVLRRAGKKGQELAYLIEWKDCQFIKELSWILFPKGREPRRFKGSKDDTVYIADKVYKFNNPNLASKYMVVKYLPSRKSPKVEVLNVENGLKSRVLWDSFLRGSLPSQRSSLDIGKLIITEMEEKNSPLAGQIEWIEQSENFSIHKVRYLKYNTIHLVYKTTLLKAKKLTIESAVDKTKFIDSLLKHEHPKLANKITVHGIELIYVKGSRDKRNQYIVEIQVKNSGRQEKVPLTYLQQNRYLSGILKEWFQLPLHAILKYDPNRVLYFYFVLLSHPKNYKSLKIGYTSYHTPVQRVKTLGNGWTLENCICFARLSAVKIYELETRFKKLPNPEVPKNYRPYNGFSEFIWTELITSRYDSLQKIKMSLEESISFLDNLKSMRLLR